jgi:hypothetical protein
VRHYNGDRKDGNPTEELYPRVVPAPQGDDYHHYVKNGARIGVRAKTEEVLDQVLGEGGNVRCGSPGAEGPDAAAKLTPGGKGPKILLESDIFPPGITIA